MIDLLSSNPAQFFIVAILLVLAISIHEFAHAFAADKLGDPTPRLQGRLSLNPLVHLDPVGTLLILFVGFGWGKPVLFDPFNLRNPKRDAAIISFAGPLSNLLMAITGAVLLRFITAGQITPDNLLLAGIVYQFIRFNVLLAVFNLLPIHPLDGFKVVAGFLSKKWYHEWLSLERYGIIFLIFLIIPFYGASPLFQIIDPIMDFILTILLPNRIGAVI